MVGKGTWSYTSSYCGNYWQSKNFLLIPVYLILFILSIPGELFGMIFKKIQSAQKYCETIYKPGGFLNRVVKDRTYRADKPEFWRWVEYALTAPLQILLIAYSVFIGDRISDDDGLTASDIEDIRANSWHTVTLWYSILSVTAKTILEGGFIALVWAQGETRR